MKSKVGFRTEGRQKMICSSFLDFRCTLLLYFKGVCGSNVFLCDMLFSGTLSHLKTVKNDRNQLAIFAINILAKKHFASHIIFSITVGIFFYRYEEFIYPQNTTKAIKRCHRKKSWRFKSFSGNFPQWNLLVVDQVSTQH